MIEQLILILLVAIAIEAITELLVDAKITQPVRHYIKLRGFPDDPHNQHRTYHFFAQVISCGYCTSVWVAAFCCLFFRITISDFVVIDFILTTALTHRLSNFLHILLMIIKKGRIKTYDIELTVKITDEENNGEPTV